MTSDKQQRMLELLEDMIFSCTLCGLHEGGRCRPYWTPISQYVIVGEAPGAKEVEFNEPFYGPAGNHLWNIMNEFGFRKEQFAIINSVNCRPVVDGKNGKPVHSEKQACKRWIRKFISVIEPQKILSLGNHAMHTLIGRETGIMSYNGQVTRCEFNDRMYRIILSVHPSMCIYKKDDGIRMLRNSIERFKNYNGDF